MSPVRSEEEGAGTAEASRPSAFLPGCEVAVVNSGAEGAVCAADGLAGLWSYFPGSAPVASHVSSVSPRPQRTFQPFTVAMATTPSPPPSFSQLLGNEEHSGLLRKLCEAAAE